MNEKKEINDSKTGNSFSQEVGLKATRKLKSRRSSQGVWFGLGMMGLVGWSVAVPTLLGVAAGIWLDNRYQGARSWTLTLLIVGLFVGCLNAWHWLSKEDKEIQEENQDDAE
jgi:ATP synthase protein I